TPVAMVYAAEHPEQVTRLMLYAPLCERYMRRDEPLGRALLDLIRAEWGVGARTTMGFVHPDADLEEQRNNLRYLRQASSGEVAARILEQGMFEADVRAYLPRISAPALVLHRRGDQAVPLEAGRQVASLLPNARFVPLEGDHHLPFDDGEDILRAVEEFLGIETVAPPEPAPSPQLDLAAGPVTILFTDMEGSTAMTGRLGDAEAQEIVRDHDTIVRESLAAHGGTEVKHTGDGVMASFPMASGALECAIQIHRALAARNEERPDAPINVRIGLNAGEPVREGNDLFGTAVQLARRVCEQAEPGQILVSNVVRELVAGKGFLFADRGEAALRGFEDPVRLYEARWAE
ncbi:MAG: adenylate/guanylate cyclase domain-containing protein, partial [Dehalococcoidia bacterium]|nr:adenylate/guanylate cyclase domain-containing protein [Dehalococcoidia bacterium]